MKCVYYYGKAIEVASNRPRRGDKYKWNGVDVTVTRVARDGTWADIRCRSGDATWTKRQRLPLGAQWKKTDGQ